MADVQLTDLEVIQQFSLAVRAATAPRSAVIAALESDLAWLRAQEAPAPAPARLARKAPAGAAPAKAAVRAPARKAASRRREA